MDKGNVYIKKRRKRAIPQISNGNTPPRNRIAEFIKSHVILVVLLTFSISTGAVAYYSPGFRQWATEAFSKAYSKVVSFIQIDYNQKTGQALIARGNALRIKKQYAAAEDAYQIAIGKFTIKEDYQGLGNAFTELGILKARTRDFKSAQREFHKAISYFDLVVNSNGLGYSHVNLAQLHLIRRHFKSARQHFLTAQQHYKATNNLEGLGNVALGLGNLHLAKKDYSKATKYFSDAESKFQQIGNKRGLVIVYNSLAHAFEVLRTKRGKEEAAQYRQLAKAIKLNTQFTALPEFSIRESLSWLTNAFNQNRDVYESELNSKAKEETERVFK